MTNIGKTTFALLADSIDEAAQGAVDHLKSVVDVTPGCGGFTLPKLVRESIERITVDGAPAPVWQRVFRFEAELLPERV